MSIQTKNVMETGKRQSVQAWLGAMEEMSGFGATKKIATENLLAMVEARLLRCEDPKIVTVLKKHHVVLSYSPVLDTYTAQTIWADGRTASWSGNNVIELEYSAIANIIQQDDASLTAKIAEGQRLLHSRLALQLEEELKYRYVHNVRYAYAKKQLEFEHEQAMTFAYMTDMTVRPAELQIAEVGFRHFVRELLDTMNKPESRWDPIAIGILKKEIKG